MLLNFKRQNLCLLNLKGSWCWCLQLISWNCSWWGTPFSLAKAKATYTCLQPRGVKQILSITCIWSEANLLQVVENTDVTGCGISSWRCSSLSHTLLMGSALGGCWQNIQEQHVLQICASNREYLPYTVINSSQRNQIAIKDLKYVLLQMQF